MKILVTQCNEKDGSCLLRLVLKANAWFSLISASLVLVAAKPFAAAMGAVQAIDLTVVGTSLISYSAVLFATAKRKSVRASSAWPFILLDVGWVVGSGFFVATAPLTTGGKWTVAVVADIVFVFAIAQLIGVRRLQKRGGKLGSTEIEPTRHDAFN